MKIISLFVLLTAFCFGTPAAASMTKPAALDTTIRILVVKDGGASQANINQQVDFLLNSWTNPTGAASGSPITITIVNPGAAIAIPMISNDASILHEEVKTYAETIVPTFTKSARDIAAADLVLAFTDNDLVVNLFDDACGSTLNGTWLGSSASFIPDAEGIDTRGAPYWYISIVESGCSAGIGTMAHEIGHLLGGQHTFGGSAPLLPDGRGDFFTHYISTIGLRISARTVMAVASVCGSGFSCNRVEEYSSVTYYGNPGRRMVNTIAKTAESVANFVRAAPIGDGLPPFPGIPPACSDGEDNDGDLLIDDDDPDCDDPSDEDETPPPPPPAPPATCDPANYVPTNVSVRRIQLCPTAYEVTWQHACPGGDYQLFGNDGAGLYLVLSTPVRSAVVGVTGPSTVRIRACSGIFCSGLSLPPVPVFDGCG